MRLVFLDVFKHRLVGGVVSEHVEDEFLVDGLLHRVVVMRHISLRSLLPEECVCLVLGRGGEANYALFVANVKREKPIVTQVYFHRLIAIGILLSTIDKIVKSKKLGGYKAAMDAYIGAALSFLSDGNLDFAYIWENQRVQQEVVDKIEELIPITWIHLTQSTYPNVLTWTKKPECWNRLKLKLNDFDKFRKELLQAEVNDDGSRLNEAQQTRIREADEIEPNTWFAIANWAKTRNLLTPLDRKAAFNFGTMRSRSQGMKSLRQAQYALKIYNNALELGFEG